MGLDPQAKAYLEKVATLNAPDVTTIGIAARYNQHDDPNCGGPIGDGAEISHRFLTTPTADVPIRIYTPKQKGPHRGLAFFHGGGWAMGHIDIYEPQLVEIAEKTNSVVVSVNYQKAPEHKFPIPFDDCYATLIWLFDNAKKLNVDPTKIGVGGSSAGGNLAAGVALKARDSGLDLAYQLLVYPATKLDFETPSYLKYAEGFGLRRDTMIWFWDQYLNTADRVNPYAVPDVAINHADLSPAIIATVEFDVLRDDGVSYAARLSAAGNKVLHKEFEGQIHGLFTNSIYFDASYVLRNWICNQINAVIGKP